MRNEGRNLRRAGKQQHQRRRSRHGGQQARQEGARTRIEADVGIVNHQDFRTAQQGARELELAQLTRGERHQRLVQHRLQPEQGDQILQASRSHRIGAGSGFLAQLLPRRGRVALQSKEIPALLHEEIAVSVAPVRITESDVFRAAAARECGRQAALAGTVRAHEGDLLPFPDIQCLHQPAIL